MNHFGRVMIGLGNKHGTTSEPIISEERSRIQITNLKATIGTNPKISIKKVPAIDLGHLKTVIAKKRNQKVLKELLKINFGSNLEEILQNCSKTQNKIESDLQIVKALVEDSKVEQFIRKTKGNENQAKVYLQKYKNVESAVKTYQMHQKKIEQFMKDQQCSREMAKQFLQANDYNEFNL